MVYRYESSSRATGLNSTKLTKPQEAVRCWLGVLSIAMAAFVIITTEFLPIGMLGKIAADNHVLIGTAGLMVALPGLIAAFAAPAAAIFSSNHDRKHLLIGFGIVVMLSNLLVAISSSFAIILVARILLGISVGGFWTFAVAAGRKLVSNVSGARATTLIISGVSIGTVVGVPLVTAFGELRGWHFAFGCLAGLTAVAVCAQLLLLSPLPGDEAVSPDSMLRLFRRPLIRTGFLATALTAAGHFAAYTYLQPLLAGRLHLSPARVTLTLVAYGVAGIFGTFIAERTTSRDLRKTFATVSLLLGAGVTMAAWTTNAGVAVGAVALWGAAFGAVPVCSQTWTFQSAPESFEFTSAMSMTVFQIALSAGSFSGGLLFDHSGIVSAFSLTALLALSCAVVLMISPSPSKPLMLREIGDTNPCP